MNRYMVKPNGQRTISIKCDSTMINDGGSLLFLEKVPGSSSRVVLAFSRDAWDWFFITDGNDEPTQISLKELGN